MKVAALFVETEGTYFNDDKYDAWDAVRDAKKYDGDFPVIAHPPCQLWGNLACVNYARWGGEHNKPKNDGGCFKFALDAVNRCGGVLEHPASTKAFAEYGIPQPKTSGWQASIFGGWVCEVWQSAYGHRANKSTWLYYNGNKPPFALRWDRPIGTHQIGGADQRGKAANKPTLSGAAASATPKEFKDMLYRLAIHSND